MSSENNVIEVKLTKRAKELLDAIVLNGKYGETVEEIVTYIANERFIYMEDIKTSAMVGLLKQGHSDEEILHMIKGTPAQNRRCLERAKLILKKINEFAKNKPQVGLRLPNK